jgi:hypothetical protein
MGVIVHPIYWHEMNKARASGLCSFRAHHDSRHQLQSRISPSTYSQRPSTRSKRLVSCRLNARPLSL